MYNENTVLPIIPFIMKQSKRISFKGQKIYIGIDVHLKSWSVSVITESGYHTTFSQPASAQALHSYLASRFSDGEYMAVYESGFTGFSTYYRLEQYGIKCSVVHAADVPTSQRESIMKTDAVDSMKLARSLRSGDIETIYIRKREYLDDRGLIRIRKAIQKNLCGHKSRIKHLLYTNGVEYPERFAKGTTHWSRAFLDWLSNEVSLLSSNKESLVSLLDIVSSDRQELLKVTKKIRELSYTEFYRENCRLLCSMPGISTLSAMTILTEIEDYTRFKNEREFASYLGLIPMCHNSGEKISQGGKTFRGNRYLGTILIEASWKAVALDRALATHFAQKCKKMKANKAIIRTAKKMANRILSLLKTGKPYEYDRLW